MKGRTVILVSHHVQLCSAGASYIVALDNGRLAYSGNSEGFKNSGVMNTLIQADGGAGAEEDLDEAARLEEEAIEEKFPPTSTPSSEAPSEEVVPTSETSSTLAPSTAADNVAKEKKSPRKLIEEEKRAVGRISKDIWLTYIYACGNWMYWALFAAIAVLATLSPVLENGWLK